MGNYTSCCNYRNKEESNVLDNKTLAEANAQSLGSTAKTATSINNKQGTPSTANSIKTPTKDAKRKFRESQLSANS